MTPTERERARHRAKAARRRALKLATDPEAFRISEAIRQQKRRDRAKFAVIHGARQYEVLQRLFQSQGFDDDDVVNP